MTLLISEENGRINVFKKKSDIKKYSGWFVNDSEASALWFKNLYQLSIKGNFIKLNTIILSIKTDQNNVK
jgi:hypothetical protein